MSATLVDSLAASRRSRSGPLLNEALDDFAASYRVSAGVLASLGETVGGWKVGVTADGVAVGAPMYRSGFLSSGGRFALKRRPVIPEVEIAVRLAIDLPPRSAKPYTRENMLSAASELLLGIELIERRVEGGGLNPLNLADDLGNIAYVLGPATSAFRGLDLANLRCRLWIGDEPVTDRRGGHAEGDPLTPMLAWANASCDRAGGMKAGQIITLGSLTPMRAITAPVRIAANLEGFGDIVVDLCGPESNP